MFLLTAERSADNWYMSKYGNYRLMITNECEGGYGKMERVQKGKDLMNMSI